MIAIVDYGVGNLFSLRSSLVASGAETIITSDPDSIRNADKIILPGVGAFEDAARKLKETGLGDVIASEAKSGKYLMGICLGMQLLFDISHENGIFKGLGLIKGEVRPISDIIPRSFKIPHIGWNSLRFEGPKSPLFKYINEYDCVYFVHSYYADTSKDTLIATTEYGADLTAAVAKDNIFGCQFHPEKSGNVGLNIIKAFMEMK